MSLPSINIILNLVDGAGSPVTTGSATFTPTVQVTSADGTQEIAPFPVTFPLGPPPFPVTVPLCPTDMAGTVPATWAWQVSFAGMPGTLEAFTFLAPAGPASFTAASGSPGVVTWTATSALTRLPDGTGVKLSGGSLPAGLTAGTTYYVTGGSGQSLSLSAAPGGSAVAFTSSGSGTLTVASYYLSGLDPVAFSQSYSRFLLVPYGTAEAGQVPVATGTGSQTVWGTPSGGGGSADSVFGRTGAVTAQSGDYSVNQVTGAAPLTSPALTGNPTAPTPAGGDSTARIATTAFVASAVSSGTGAGVASVTAADGSVIVGGTGTAPTVRTGTLNAIAAAHPPVAAVAMNAQKITGLASGTASTDATAFGQVPAGGSTVTVAQGGTGATTAAAARTSLGVTAATFTAPGLVRQLEFNIADYGAIGDAYLAGTTTYNTSATSNTAAITAAITAASAAGGGVVVIPPYCYMTDTLSVPDSVSFRGVSRKQSCLVLKAGSTTGCVLVSVGFGTGTAATSSDDSWSGISYLNIENLSLDGNQVNQAVASGQSDYRGQWAVIKLYAWHMSLRNVEIRNCKENGLYTEHAANWDDTFNQYQFAESVFENVFVKNFGGAGWCNRGPHDSRAASVYLSSYNIGGTSAFAGYVQEGGSNYGSSGMILDNLHVWGQFSTNAVYVSGSNILSGFIYGEGSTGSAVYLSGVYGSKFTATVGYCAAGVELAGGSSGNVIDAGVQSNVTGGLFQLDGAVFANRLTQVTYSGNPGGAVFDLAAGGAYTGSGNGFVTTHPTGATLFSGTPNIADKIDARSENAVEASRLTVYQLPVGTTRFQVRNDSGTALVDAGAMQVKNVAGGTAVTDAASYGQAIASALSPVINAVNGTAFAPSTAYGAYQVNATGACTGLTIAAGTVAGQRITILNYSNFTLTFAVAATSLVADGTSDVIAGFRAGTFWWSGFFWYRD